MKADVTLDCMGLYCPIPIAQTAKRIKELKAGQVLELLSDDMGILEDMPAWCKMTGNQLLAVEEEGKTYHVFVRKSE